MSGFRQQQHADEEIATATVLIEQKRFHIGLKANANGKFLKITEIGPGVGRKNKVKGRTRRTRAQDTFWCRTPDVGPCPVARMPGVVAPRHAFADVTRSPAYALRCEPVSSEGLLVADAGMPWCRGHAL